MSLENDLVSYLTGTSAVAALMADRMMPLVLEGALPAIVYQLIDRPPGLAAGYVRPRVRLSMWAEDYDGAKALAAVVRTALDNYHGLLGSTHALTRVVSDRDGERDPETGYFRVILEVLFFHQQ